LKRNLALLLVLGAAGPVPAADDDDIPVVRLAVQPAKEPVPALKYHLLPELRERTPGNRVLLYYRAFSPEWQTHRQPETARLLEEWEAGGFKKPPEALRRVAESRALRELDLAARREFCAWELTERARKDGAGLLLPDVQGFREYARVLVLRSRFAVADGKPDRAAATMQTMFQLSRDLSDNPTLIQSLVGMAIATMGLKEVENWVQAPNAPSLYWALTDLPRPLIDLRTALQGERLFVDNLFPGVRDMLAAPTLKPMSPEEIEKIVKGWADVAGELKLTQVPGLKSRVALAATAAALYPRARRALIAAGHSAKEVDALPVLQVAILYEVHEYDRIYDDMIKWCGLSYWESRPALARVSARLKGKGPSVLGGTLARLLLPALDAVLSAQMRLDRRVAALRCVEAVRLYAGAHGGKLPARLRDVTEVPVPPDPMTGLPFKYELDGKTAALTVPPPRGERANPGNCVRYEITIKK
jgi:hypothetical protein